MYNLYVDDVRPCPYIGWTVARTVEEAKRHIASGQVKHMSLDHDMGVCHACSHGGENFRRGAATHCAHVPDGTALVRWMIENNHWSKEKPTVHSANPVGRERMRGMIERYWDEREV